MARGFSLFMAVAVMVLTISLIALPQEVVHAEIDDGTYEIDYEMKEAASENTSIADGYFTKPATLTVKNGEQYIQLMVTSSSMIKSLSTPTGEVDVIEEDESEETRIVKFRVDEDLSEPVDVEMHIVVPDLYDTTHTARAVFDVSNLEKTDIEDEDAEEDTSIEEQDENAGNDAENENNVIAGEDNAEASPAENVDADEDSQEEENNPNTLWITLTIIGILVVGVLLWMVQKRKYN